MVMQDLASRGNPCILEAVNASTLLSRRTAETMKGFRAALAFGLLCLTASLSPSDAQNTASSQVTFVLSS